VLAWTVNTPESATALAAMKVDALCTDALPQLQRAFAS
jgi:glycerophosphoryl diester phosphodiesterase